MIALGQHWEFVAAGYLGVGLVVVAMIGWTILDSRRQKARIAALEAEGHTRGGAR